MRVPSGGCHLLSVDDETFHACWIRRHDTGRSNILPKKIEECLLHNQSTSNSSVNVWAVWYWQYSGLVDRGPLDLGTKQI